MIDRDAARDGQALGLGTPDGVEALGAANGGSVIATAGHLDEAEITIDDDGFGKLVHTAQAKAGR